MSHRGHSGRIAVPSTGRTSSKRQIKALQLHPNASRPQRDAGNRQSHASERQTNAGGRQTFASARQLDASTRQPDAGDRQPDARGWHCHAGDRQMQAGGRQTSAGDRRANARDRQTSARGRQLDTGDRHRDAEGWHSGADDWPETAAGAPGLTQKRRRLAADRGQDRRTGCPDSRRPIQEPTHRHSPARAPDTRPDHDARFTPQPHPFFPERSPHGQRGVSMTTVGSVLPSFCSWRLRPRKLYPRPPPGRGRGFLLPEVRDANRDSRQITGPPSSTQPPRRCGRLSTSPMPGW